MALTRPRASQIYDIDYKQATRVVTVANITLAGGAPNQVDSVNLSLNDRILVTGQSTASQNGLYYVSTLGSGSNGTWTRSSDSNTTGELLSGTIVMVTEGTIYADTQWKLITDGTITIGVTPLTFVQNYSANSISSGNSNVTILNNSSILMSSAGSANVLKVDSGLVTIAGSLIPSSNVTYSLGNTTNRFSNLWLSNTTIYLGNVAIGATATQLTVNGANVVTATANSDVQTSGNISATGNVAGGNILTAGVVSSTGNAIAGNILTAGVVSAVGNATAGNILTAGVVSSTGNAIAGNILTAGVVSATANVTGGNILTAGLLSATSNVIGGNISTTGNVTANYFLGNVACASGIYATKIFNGTSEANIGTANGNANISINGTSNVVVVTSTGILVTGVASATGNVTGGNILTSGLVSATSNVTAGNILTAGQVSSTGNATAGNILTAGIVSSTGTATVGNLVTAGIISAVGNIYATTITTTAGTNGNLVLDPDGVGDVVLPVNTELFVQSNAVSNSSSNGAVVISGGVGIAGNIYAGGLINATSNIIGNNLLTAGVVSATGNITGNYLIGNGSQVTGINSFSQIFVTGSSTVNASGLTSNVTFAAGSNISLTSANNIITIAYSSSSSSSIFATGGDMGLISQAVTASQDLGNVVDLASLSYDLGGLFNTVTYNQIDMTGFTSNINTGNLNATGLVSAAGNIIGNYILGNGSQLTGVVSSATFPLSSGNSNISAVANSNISINVGGTSNIVVWSTTGGYVTGLISATGNITAAGNISGNYFVGNGAALTGITSTPPPLNITLQQSFGGF